MIGCLIVGVGTLVAQTTWDGSSSSDWNTAANWSAGIPDANDDVTIPNVANDPVLNGVATAKSVTVQSGAVLTINAGGSLTCNGSTGQHMNNNGTINNSGSILLGNLQGSSSYGFNNTGTFNNSAGATFNLSNVSQYTRGIWNTATGTITNNGKIILGEYGDVGTDAIWNDGAFNNASCTALIHIIANGDILGTGGGATFTNAGVIIENSSWNSSITSNSGVIQNLSFGSFTVETTNTGLITLEPGAIWMGCTSTNWNVGSNWSKGVVPAAGEPVVIPNRPNDPIITTGANASCGFVLILTDAQLTISANASLSVDGSGNNEGFRNHGTVTNNGTLNIGGVSNGGSQGLANQGTFHNNSGAQVNINRTSFTGLSNSKGTFNNYSQITIGGLASAGEYGFYNQGVFTNYVGGVIKVDNATLVGFRNSISATFNNNGQVAIGSVSAVGTLGLQNWGVFNNNATGEVTIDRSNQYGFDNGTGLTNGFLDNQGKITIGALASVGTAGVHMEAGTTFNNNACGQLVFHYPLRNYGSFTNTGLIRSITSASHDNPSPGLTNNGLIEYPLGNTIPNVTNNDLIIKPFSMVCSGSPALEIGGSNSFTIGTTWYSNQALTVPAGTFNLASNAFTWNSTPANGTYTVYFSVNDAGGGCTRTLSAAVTVVSPVAANAGPNQSICTTTGSVTMAGNTPNVGTGTWSKISGPSGGTINSPNAPNTTITGLATEGTYVFQWAISNPGCPANTSQVSIVVKAPPTAANAGSNANPCSLTTNLAGNTATTGTGTWTLFNGPGTANFANANAPTTSVTVSVAGTYTFRWTIANAPCTASSDDVVIAFTTAVTPANAGGDQTICTTSGSATMAGNTPTVGTGTWSQVSGPSTAAILSPNAPTTSIIDMTTAGTYVFKWSITNPPCIASEDQISVVVKAPPTAANAGLDASPCGLTTSLAGNVPAVGTGTWTLFNGPGTANFVNASTATTNVTVSVPGVYTFRWTIANAPCTASTDDVVVTFTAGPTTANAGNDQTICSTSGSATMAGNTPSVGTGTWSQTSGPTSANITAPNSPTTTITGMTTAGTYVFKWSIANAPCAASEDQVNLVVNAPPTVANAGLDASPCGLTTSLAGNVPTVGTGTWTLFNGPGTANFVNANNATTNVTVSVAGIYTFRWTIANAPCTASTNDVNIAFTAGPTTANAGNDQTICTTSGSAAMAGNTPSVGTGTWSQTSGPISANITAPNSPTTTITGMTTAGTYVFKWSIANAPCTASEDQVNLVVNAPPTVANAGLDASPCGLTTSLAGNVPAVGTGTWTLFNGPGTANFVNANNATTNVTVSVAGIYTFRWTIANAPCTASTNDVNITFTAGPTTANAGNDQTICTTSGSAAMAGNTPSVGTGTWSQTSGPISANITAPNSPTTPITGMTTAGTYVFKWSIANAPCAASEDQVDIVVKAPPTNANAGTDASACGLTTSLGGNTAIVGTGTWTLFNGPGTANFVNVNNATTNVTVSIAGVYTFRWTIANAPCTASFDDVAITFTAAPTVANAGADQIGTLTCNNTQVVLAANTPTVGTGVWSVVSGTGGNFGDPGNPTTTFSGSAGATYTLRWTVTNAPCSASTDEMAVTFNQAPSFSACPPGVTVSTTSGCSTVATYTASTVTTTPATALTYNFSGATASNGNGTGSGSTFNLGTTLVSLTATNSCGTSNCSFNVVVQAPEINVQGNAANIVDGDATPSPADHTDFGQTVGAALMRTFTVQNMGTAALVVTGIAPSGPNANQFGVGALNPASPIPAGQSASFTVTYAPNTVGIHNATITITNGDCDEPLYDFAVRGELTCSAPTFTACPTATVEINTPTNGCSAMANYTVSANGLPAPALTYTFAGATTGNGNGTGSGSSFNKGTTTVTVTATNPCGAPVCSFSVRVTDNVSPSIACPTPMTVSNTAGQCGALVNYTPSISDNCSGATFTVASGPASGSLFPLGTTTVLLQASDAAGLTATCTFTVRVNDAELPNIICPNNIVKSSDAGICGAAVTYTNPIYTDNCAGAGLDHLGGGLSGSTFSVGSTTVTWMATDAANNTRTCTFSITVNDAQAPTIVCPANMVQPTTAGQCAAQVTYNTPVASDNCTAPTLQWVSGGTGTTQGSTTSTGVFAKGATTVQWKATDVAGQTKTCTFRIIVNDTEAPTMYCPSGLNVDAAPGQCGATVTYTMPTFTDNCAPTSGTAVRVSGPPSGSMFSVGTINVVFRATDAAGNTRQCTLTVTVVDNQPPTISCPPSLTVTGSGLPCAATTFYAAPTASDNCAGVLNPFLVSGLASGSTYPGGVTVNTWRASDPNGVTAECAFSVTVNCPAAQPMPGVEDRVGEVSSLWLVPNPAATEVTISIQHEKESSSTLFVHDATGRLVWQQNQVAVSAVRLDVSAWPSGVYVVSWRQGETVKAKRLVVAKI